MTADPVGGNAHCRACHANMVKEEHGDGTVTTWLTHADGTR